jgi:hypothetical protein
MTTRRPVTASQLRIRWTLATALGLAAGLIAGLLLGDPVEAVVGMLLVTPVLTGIVGMVFGTPQWLLLRRRLAASRWWIPASALGLGTGLALGVVAVEVAGILLTGERPNVLRLGPLPRAASMAVVGLTAGLCLGAAQWLVLRRRASRAWIWRSCAAFGVALTAASLAVDTLLGGIAGPAGLLAFVLLTGLIAGGLTSGSYARLVAA